MTEIVLLVGLGNPGPEYECSRHNAGFQIVDVIASKFGVNLKKMSQLAEVGAFFLGNRRIIVAKPQTFMNLSGRAVRFLVDFYKIPVSNVFVFHDDIDLTFGRVKIKNGGGNGGHNGLKSIDSVIGTNYWRVRIGVGRPEYKSEITNYVLGKFKPDEKDTISQIADTISENLESLLDDRQKLEMKLHQHDN